MDHDLVIRSGTVIDGTGGPARTADVAVRGDRIVEVGRVDGRGAREIDAAGAIVTPGFVDIHTHYDGQATWDDRLTPSSDHGVTTVVAGNCGVGFAPVRPADHAMLIELMEGVEDLPGVVLDEGLSWEWESIGDFLDVLERRHFDVDLAAQVCHAPVRVYVMGERGANRDPATADEIEAMGRLAAEGIRAGCLGFSTSRTLNHRTSRGEPTPTLTAAHDELVGIARAIGETGAGVLQVVSDFRAEDEDGTLLEMMRASGRPLSFSLLQTSPGTGYRSGLTLLDRAAAEGLSMRAQVAARPVGVLVGLQGSVNPLARCPSHQAVADLPVGEQAAALSVPERREQLVAEAREVVSPRSLAKVFELGTPPCYEPAPEDAVGAKAERLGVDPVAFYVDLLLADEGRALLYVPFLNYADGNLDAAAELIGHAHTVPGLGDGGAHVGTICDASFPTTLLTHWARDRERGTTFDLPFLIQRQCRGTAETVGLLDRGLLAPGLKADINVIDFDHLAVEAPTVVADLPAGGKRLVQGAHGYLHTFVSGVETQSGGQPTDARPGRLVRGARGGGVVSVVTGPRVLEPACEWTASDLADESLWTETLTEEELAELDAALRHALERSDEPLELAREDFPLPHLGERLARIERELINGRGVVRLRGIDRSAYTQDEIELVYWGIGLHLGNPLAQNKHGHVLGDVTDQAKTFDDPTARGNELGGIALPFHCDGADLVGLLCIENGISGGLSAVSNSVRIHNRLVRERPELAAVLYDPYPYDFRGEQPAGGRSFYSLPVFTEWDDRLFVRCIPGYIWASQRHDDAPRLTDLQREALRAVEEMAAEPENHVLMELAPGDIQFINNFHVLHGRTAYEDDRGAGQVRHLKRLWLETSELTSRPPHFASRSHWEANRSTSRLRVAGA